MIVRIPRTPALYTVILLLLCTTLMAASQSPLSSASSSPSHSPSPSPPASNDIYTFQLQDSGFTEPGHGEPARIDAAKEWARSLDDPTSIRQLIIVTYMLPHITFTDLKDRSEVLILVDWTQGRMIAKMETYTGEWRGHLDRIFGGIVQGVNERVKTMDGDGVDKKEQLAELFEGFRGSHIFLD